MLFRSNADTSNKRLYVSLMVTTKQKKLTVDSQKTKRRKSEHTTTENHQFTKEGSKTGKKGNYKTARKKSIRWY